MFSFKKLITYRTNEMVHDVMRLQNGDQARTIVNIVCLQNGHQLILHPGPFRWKQWRHL